ncbi:MAG: copper resistance protein NlpE N-terminal domain-containing protein, partial [Caldilineaceae bacterium]
ELGTWSMSDDGVSMVISLTGGPNSVFEAPIEWTFAVEGDTLTATEWDETIYGSDVLVLERTADETVVGSPDGVWVSSILPAASSPGQVVLLILYADSTLQSSTWYLNNELPIIEDGTWADNGDGTVTLTVTGSTEREYDAPQELVFDFDGETLTYLSLQLTRLEAAESANGPQPLAFYTTEVGPAASSPGLQRSLIFYDDNSVQMVSDYLNGEDPIIEEGSWSENDDGNLTVTLTGTADETYAEPVVIVFELSDGTLTAIEWDEAIFGSAGLAFTEQNLDDLVLEESDPVSGEANDLPEANSATTPTTTVETAPTSETITATVDRTATEPITETESATGAVPAPDTDALLDAAAPFEAPEGAEAVYASDVLPAASSPGRLVRLVLFVDGTAQEITDFLNGEAPIVELGTWEEIAAGEILVTLTGRPLAEPYAVPIETTFAQTGDTLTAVQWDETIYGSEPLTLTLVEGE